MGWLYGAELVALLVALLIDGRLATDLLLGVIAVATWILVRAEARVRRAGLWTRERAAQLGFLLLMSLLTGGFMWFGIMSIADESAELGIRAAASVVALGLVTVSVFDGRWVRALLTLGGCVVVLGILNVAGLTYTSSPALRFQLATMPLETGELAGWRAAAALHEALDALGQDSPELSSVRADVARAMRSDDKVHPLVWTSAHAIGWVEPEDWQALSRRRTESYRLDQLLKERMPFPRTSYQQYVLPMLLASREVGDAARERLSRKVLDTWPKTGDHGALERAAACVRSLEELGRSDLIETLSEPALALLSDHWISPGGALPFKRVGGFSPNPEEFKTSMPDDTLHGIELMERFGVPDGVDLLLLRDYVRGESQSIPPLLPRIVRLKAKSRASLVRLTERVGLPKRTLLRTLLAERLLIAAGALVLLCLNAIRRAPRSNDVPAGR